MRRPISEVLTIPELLALFRYDSASGKVYWRFRNGEPKFNSRFANKEAGCLKQIGYRHITLKIYGTVYTLLAHRIIAAITLNRWLTDCEEVDHINGIRDDNRWENLRICDRKTNGKNQSLHRSNSSGYKGVYFNRQANRWLAQICSDGSRKSIGYYDIAEDAAKAYDSAALNAHGDYAKTNAGMGLL